MSAIQGGSAPEREHVWWMNGQRHVPKAAMQEHMPGLDHCIIRAMP